MKVQLISGLYLQSAKTDVERALEDIVPNIDVLVIAGNIGRPIATLALLKALDEQNDFVTLVVPGPLDYAGSSLKERDQWFDHKVDPDMPASLQHVLYMNPGIVTIQGQRFVSPGPLWYEDRGFGASRPFWPDFQEIEDLEECIDLLGRSQETFLKRVLRPDDIVITHFAPSRDCLVESAAAVRAHPDGRNLTEYFYRDIWNKVDFRAPKIWMTGTGLGRQIWKHPRQQTYFYSNARGDASATWSSYERGFVIDTETFKTTSLVSTT